ncbi:MAG: hypothetical protein ACLRLW_09330 [Terrisporobacter sp.]|uniref:hypothetical protein n=1 Tax=Terrisporobacter sp. TaxID=1965305 RepID=UPI0039A1B4BE
MPLIEYFSPYSSLIALLSLRTKSGKLALAKAYIPSILAKITAAEVIPAIICFSPVSK